MKDYSQNDLFGDIEDFRIAEQEQQKNWERAVTYAEIAHDGQTRDEGTPYFEHVYRVAMATIKPDQAPDTRAIVAVLHDTIEDTQITYEDIKAKFGAFIADAVRVLSKDKTDPNYSLEKYLNGIVNYEKGNDIVSIIKLYDRIDNIKSLAMCPDQEKKKRYLNETKNTFLPIFRACDMGQWKEYYTALKTLELLVNEADAV